MSAAIAEGSNAFASTAFTAFYVPWDSGSRSDLTQHMRVIDVFVPQWFTLIDRQGTVTTALDSGTRALLSQTHHPVAVMPLVSNAHDGTWDSAAAEAVIDDPVAQIAFVHQLAALAQGQHYQGYVLDFENLPPASTAKMPQLLGAIHAALPGAI